MIDPHVHLRDWNQRRKETVAHGLQVALRAGLDAVFEMPNTDPPLTSKVEIERRLRLADEVRAATRSSIFHGLFAGLTAEPAQIEEVVAIHRERFPRVVGLKLFAGHSTGNMGILSEERQRWVMRQLVRLCFDGVLAVHCEKESRMRPGLWDPEDPFSHALARPPEAEVESIGDMIAAAKAAGFEGVLHVCHISTVQGVERVALARKDGLRVTCGVTPHHLLLTDGAMRGEQGLLFKMNPPLRDEQMRRRLVGLLEHGAIDWIESDHAPHSLTDKTTGRGGYASGVPVLPVYPRLVNWLAKRGLGTGFIERVTHGNIAETFDIPIKKRGARGALDLAVEYEFDPFADVGEIQTADL